MATLHYGNNLSVQLEFADGVMLGELGGARVQPVSDVGAATTAALVSPIDYPPLAMCTTPGDRVVLAIDHETPQLAQIVAAVVGVLIESGVTAEAISVLQPPAERGIRPDNPCRLLPVALRNRIVLLTHDPEEREQLAYLAANQAGEAILVHRSLHDADVVLPIGCFRNERTIGYFGMNQSVFPVFSDTKTCQRFRGVDLLNEKDPQRRVLAGEVEHVAQLLGINFTIQVVPGAGDQVLHVLAGETAAVRRHGVELYRAAWTWSSEQRASLVIAGIEGGTSRQTWENVGRTLHAAEQFVEEDGAIVICSELSVAPGPAMRRMAHASSCESGLRHLDKDRPFDALPAAQLARALQQHKVYLWSRLEASVVEELDVIPISGSEELERLSRQHASCILLSNAPYVMTG